MAHGKFKPKVQFVEGRKPKEGKRPAHRSNRAAQKAALKYYY